MPAKTELADATWPRAKSANPLIAKTLVAKLFAGEGSSSKAVTLAMLVTRVLVVATAVIVSVALVPLARLVILQATVPES